MTRAICIRCGNEKHGCWTPCPRCGHQPFGTSEVAWSLVLSDHTMTDEGLAEIGEFISENKRLPSFGEEVEAAFRRCEETVRGAARGLVKKGLLPVEDAPEAATPLVGATATIALSARVQEAIEDFCLNHSPPAKPEAVLEWIIEDWLEREGYFD